MIMTLLTYVLIGVHLLFPPYLAVRLWRHRFRTLGAWAVEASFTLLAIATLMVIGRWDVAGATLGYTLAAASFVGALVSAWQVAGKPFSGAEGIRWRWGALVEGLVFTGFLVWGIAGMWPDRPTVDLASPLHGDGYNVAHGGGTPPINYHGAAAESQTYALDINRLNGWGMRSTGVSPSALDEYAIFGDPIYSPLAGTVVHAADTLADQPPPETKPEHPAGNHVWLSADSLYVLLAHMKQGSLQVEEGDTVSAGTFLGRVGNTGNTTEPHLHLHAVTFPDGAPPADSLGGGRPVPVTIDGRFLVRNNRLNLE